MRLSLLGDRRRALLLVALAVVGVTLTVRAERGSESRANRLHRAGALEEAVGIYVARGTEDAPDARLRYNLGTTLLRLGSAQAHAELVAGGAADDPDLQSQARYNLGLWSLIQALITATNDSVLFHAAQAVEANKDALRLDPELSDARWNLALAQRILVNATPEEGPGNIEPPNGEPDVGEIQLVNEPQPFQEESGIEETPSDGDEETRALEDLEPLSPEEAASILGTGHLDPTTMAGKLMTREGRSRRRRGDYVAGPPW